MKLVFDNNLSHKLVVRLEDIFPGSTHVMVEQLDEADDQTIWAFALEHGFAILSKDSDYSDLSVIRGSPPKVIWLQIGNCRVEDVEKIIRENIQAVSDFLNDPNSDLLSIG